jgi:single-strand DNA-binding protein
MAGLNKVMLIGNLGKDPELKYLPSGQAVVSFPLATTERRLDKNGQRQEKTEWHNIVVYGRMAEVINQYLKKGRSAFIEGRISTRSWEKDGVKKYRTEIIASNIQFLDMSQNAKVPNAVVESTTEEEFNNEVHEENPVDTEDNLPF